MLCSPGSLSLSLFLPSLPPLLERSTKEVQEVQDFTPHTQGRGRKGKLSFSKKKPNSIQWEPLRE